MSLSQGPESLQGLHEGSERKTTRLAGQRFVCVGRTWLKDRGGERWVKGHYDGIEGLWNFLDKVGLQLPELPLETVIKQMEQLQNKYKDIPAEDMAVLALREVQRGLAGEAAGLIEEKGVRLLTAEVMGDYLYGRGTQAEVGALHNLTAGAVWSRFRTARKQLRGNY